MRYGRILGAVCAAAVAAGAGVAHAAGPGETFMAGSRALEPGVTAAGGSGFSFGTVSRTAVSASGRYIAFASQVDALSTDDDDDTVQVFRKDRQTGEIVLVSRTAAGAPIDGDAGNPDISDDGMRVSFETAVPAAPGDADTGVDAYVRNLGAGTTTLATPGTGGSIGGHTLSGNGRYVAFTTPTSLDPDDGNAESDAYRYDLDSPGVLLLSYGTGGAAAGGSSGAPAISADGRRVAFTSTAANLVVGFADGNGAGSDVFVRTIGSTVGTSVTELVSRSTAAAAQGGNGPSRGPAITEAAGLWRVAFDSDATDVDSDAVDTGNSDTSVFLRVQGSPGSLTVSRADGAAGANADNDVAGPSISRDGNLVAFTSRADNLGGPPTETHGVYLRDVAGNRTVRLSGGTRYDVFADLAAEAPVAAWVAQGAVVADQPSNLSSVYARTFAVPGPLGPVELVPRQGATPVGSGAFDTRPDNERASRAISADGRYVVMSGSAPGLPGGEQPGGAVYRRDTLTGEFVLVSRASGPDGAPANGESGAASISADGNRVAFRSIASNLAPDADGTKLHVYVRDIAAGTTVMASRADGPSGAPIDAGDGFSTVIHIGAAGDSVLFESESITADAPAGGAHLYVRRLSTGDTLLVDRADGAAGAIANASPGDAAISGDGRLVAFASAATNLGFAGGKVRLYVRDTVAGTTRMVSRRDTEAGVEAATSIYGVAISTDGRSAGFVSSDETLVPGTGPWGGNGQLVVRDLVTHTNRLASRAAGDGAAADAPVNDPWLSADGRLAAFTSIATNLLPGRGGDSRDAVFVRDLASGSMAGPPAFGRVGTFPQTGAGSPSISDNGNCLFFRAQGHTGTGFGDDVETAYVYVISGECTSRLAPEAPAAPPVSPAPQPATPTPRPRLTRVSLLNTVFRVGAPVQRLTRAQKRRGVIPKGTRVRFTLDRNAVVRAVIERALPGKRLGKRCVRPTARLRAKRGCVRFVRVMTLTRQVTAGNRSIAITGRVGSKRLRPGRHRVVLRAVNAAGSSAPVTRAFRVVR